MIKLLTPLKSIKAKYIPLLGVYFSVGFAGLASVTSTIFTKNHITLSAEELISISIWTSLPWSIKMVFGALIDGVKLFGCSRKNYIYLGNILIFLGTFALIDHASTRLIIGHCGEYIGLLLSGLLTVIGVVISDIVADTMAIELVEEGENKSYELGMVQVLSRLSLGLGALLGAFMTGYLATNFTATTVYIILLICPTISLVSTALIKLEKSKTKGILRKGILVGGISYGLFCVLAGMLFGEHSQLIVFFVALTVIISMLATLLRSLPKETINAFVISMIAIFLFRTVPGIGPAGTWFYMDVLGFDANFLGTLSIVAAVTSFSVLLVLGKYVSSPNIFKTMVILTTLVTILSLPDIVVFYKIHELLGISAKHIILIDTALIGPMGQLAMIPLGVLVAKNAPKESRAVYIALTASLMNIALVAGDLITKYLNTVFIVSRKDFSQLGLLMIYSLAISTILSIIGLVVLKRSE